MENLSELYAALPLSGISEQFASAQPGESAMGEFGAFSSATTQAGALLGPVKTVISSVKGVFTGAVSMIKNKQWKKIIIAGVIALVWLVIMILGLCGIHIGVLDWLTFAHGGLGSSTIIGWIGGLLGKTAVATLIFKLISGGYKNIFGGVKSLISGENFKPQGLKWLLFGAGSALMIYQFFAGPVVGKDTMPAISCALLSTMALGGNSGFLSRFARSVTAKVEDKIRIPQADKAGVLLTGVTYGFTLGAAVSFIPFGWLPVILGVLCISAGVVLIFAFSGAKEAKA